MNIFSTSSLASSSSSAKPSLTLFTPSQNSIKSSSKFSFKVLCKIHTRILSFPPCSAHQSSSPLLDQKQDPPNNTKPYGADAEEDFDVEIEAKKESLKKVLVVRRPVKEVPDEDSGDVVDDADEELTTPARIDASLNKFAKKMPIFEPERVDPGSEEKLLTVNLDLALYKAKNLIRNYRCQEAEKILEKCINYWPEDGRAYVALGKMLSKQSKITEARAMYAKGSQATQGENAYIWQCWAVLENKVGNIGKARELFDAATVADKKHVAAWHGWGVLELKQGNIRKARQLLAKGLKFCGGNEYIYQTLALLEAKANRYEQARDLFRQATKCNPRSCASWLAWAQMEMQQENNGAARMLLEKAVQASPKNRFAWQVWGVFEANMGDIEKGRKLLKIGHILNPWDPVLLQSLALIEYKYSNANLARSLFRKASKIDPKHQPVWVAWGWMEWKEGNLAVARDLYQRALSIDSTSDSAARCLQAWGVLEQRVGNFSAARRLFRSSLNINSQSYITWMTWASLEEDQGNAVRAEEIRNLYFQQRIEVVDDASWVMGFMDIIDPALERIKRLLNLERNSFSKDPPRSVTAANESATDEEVASPSSSSNFDSDSKIINGFDLDGFIREKLSLDPDKLDAQSGVSKTSLPRRREYMRKVFRPRNKYDVSLPQTDIQFSSS